MQSNQSPLRKVRPKKNLPFRTPTEERTGFFVIHEHFATRHHFDLRIELDGLLKSWAIPKEIPLIPGEKRLAVQVEDHSLSYGTFEGEIPEGSYGAGKVLIWDKGTFFLKKRKSNEIVVELKGEKIQGTYILLRFTKEKNNWLLFQKNEKSKNT